MGAALRRAAAARCPSCATSPAISRTTGLQATLDHRPRHRLAAGHHAADDRRRALRRLRPAADLDHLHAAQPVPRGARGEAGVPARTRTRSSSIYVRSRRRRPGAAQRRSRVIEQRTTPLAVNHQGQFPVGHGLVQPGARRRRSGEAVEAIDAGQARARPAAEHPGRLPGHGAGVPGVAGQRAAADPRGAGHGLHRARRALRELHPPDHDPLDAAVGGRRRAAGADALPAPSSASSR